MGLVLLDDHYPDQFPDPRESDDAGLIAVSSTLGINRLTAAYRKGIFPWIKMQEPPYYWCWYSPNPRMLLYPSEFKISRSLKRTLTKGNFEVKIDQNFSAVMRACASAKRPNQESTWIEPEMETEYALLHQQGIAHSIEVYWDNELVGGLYGLALGRAFFGESMFHKVSEASKVSMHRLIDICLAHEISFIDCQISNPFLLSLGAREVNRSTFLDQLDDALRYSKSSVNWNELAKK